MVQTILKNLWNDLKSPPQAKPKNPEGSLKGNSSNGEPMQHFRLIGPTTDSSKRTKERCRHLLNSTWADTKAKAHRETSIEMISWSQPIPNEGDWRGEEQGWWDRTRWCDRVGWGSNGNSCSIDLPTTLTRNERSRNEPCATNRNK